MPACCSSDPTLAAPQASAGPWSRTSRGWGWLRVLVGFGAGLGTVLAAVAADWPMHRGDVGRTAWREVALSFPLVPAWRHASASPRPAWGPPARRSYWQRLERLEPRVVDDGVHPAVIAGDAVVLGSSTEDRVTCLAADSGEVRWTFWTDGPVRYAPVVDGGGGRVVFGSDDGWVYAVGLGDGRLAWRHRAGPEDWRIPGNGRIIGSWPVRAGLLVDGGTVYGTAGLYPQQGAFVFALEAATGAVRWQQPMAESPEGYLLASGSMLVVPTGRASPVGVDRDTGRILRSFDTGGGTYAVVSGGELFGGPGNQGTLTAVAAPTGRRLVSVTGRNLVAAGSRIFLIEGGTLQCVDRARQAILEGRVRDLEARIRAAGEGRVGAGGAGGRGLAKVPWAL